MAKGPFYWTIKEVAYETDNAVTIVFDTGTAALSYLPGQFINITLLIQNQSVCRSYSLSSHPSEPCPAITVKRVAGGIMSNYLINNWQEIKTLKVEGPFGNFVFPASIKTESPVVFLTGGSGISPVYSLIKEIIRSNRTGLVLYANRSADDVIFKERLTEILSLTSLQIVHALSSDTADSLPGGRVINARLSRLVIKKLLKESVNDLKATYYFICGPVGLTALFLDVLENLGIPRSQIITELFTHEASTDPGSIMQDQTYEVLFNWQEDASVYTEAGNAIATVSSLIPVLPGETILAAGQKYGIRLAASCLTGTCGTCMARCISGAVKMVQNFALTEEEVRDNMILLCQAYPQNDNVTIDVFAGC